MDLAGFAREIAEMLWEGECCDLDAASVQDLLVAHGIVHYRKPTAAELSDPEWWGHQFDIGPNDDGVGEFTPEMKQLKQPT
jgi:hypothetical protein